MVSFKWIQGAAVTLATLGTVLPTEPVLADGPSKSRPAFKTVNAQVVDIALASGGTFKGRVVDHSGTPIEGAEVTIKQNNKDIGRGVTDKTGTFAVSNLKTGVYTVASGNTSGAFRLWSEKSAPPSAKEQGLLVMGENGARGNFGAYDGGWMFLFLGGVAAASLAVGIAGLVRADQVANHPHSP